MPAASCSKEDVIGKRFLSSEETVESEFGIFERIPANYPKYVVTVDEISRVKCVMALCGRNVAISYAGAALHLGAEKVYMACLEDYDHMTAYDKERERFRG